MTQFLLQTSLILSQIVPILLIGSLVGLVIGGMMDIIQKKFRWSKYALIALGISFLLMIIFIQLTYQAIGSLYK